MPRYDVIHLNGMLKRCINGGKVADPSRFTFSRQMGDRSRDEDYLGERLGICYERLGGLHAAKYWYGRAVQEGPELRLEAAQA
ncbi:hypothetical protein [uncultured Agrobacterium sp.]|uniref:hypothetical protein n=1 Tax=uncultured Agrobacterium sp. TaxID=157277 RepID=UPI0025DFA078|nr:hypothetical protein [uncultured Agrobacterium sp.]